MLQGDKTGPLRSSLAGMRLGERGGGGHSHGLASRAFSHADLHSLSVGYNDLLTPYGSHPDLAGFTVSASIPVQAQLVQVHLCNRHCFNRWVHPAGSTTFRMDSQLRIC